MWEKSTVMNEFMKIASEANLLNAHKKVAYPQNPYQEDLKTIEEKRLKAPEKNIIEQAHPEPVYIAEARGDGGLVENEIENQKKMIEVINKHPTGSLTGRYASAVNELVKLANKCDDMGEVEAANLLTLAAEHLLADLGDGSPLK